MMPAANDNNMAMTHEMARALCDAGYMPVEEYLRLCKENGWA